ncbi:MAG: hypothetical protein KBG48_29900 [Kofleriaceae bacterium]|jgi:hypothetical protein|nr:hypothetical protein [Kofleriaceae bacterium]MBP9171642.1 hypothetical protein [Kofleriaceae bacterium]MBP9858981.1 hypothetical protein [Kofleriaceae bacterium]
MSYASWFAALALAVVACSGGDGPPITPLDAGLDAPAPIDAPMSTGTYDSPDDFDRSGCLPGSLAGFDPQGIYHLQIDFDGFRSTTAARFDVLGGGTFGGILAGRDATAATSTADDVFLYRRIDDQNSRALDLCARQGDVLRGQYAFCNMTGCLLGQVTAKKVVRLAEPAASGLTLLGEYSDPTWGPGIGVNVRVEGDLAYLARYQDGLRILDISDPANIREVGHAPTEDPTRREIYNDVKLVAANGRRYAIMASDQVGAVVWDVTTPSAPRIVAHLGTGGRGVDIHTLFLDGGRAYLANTSLGLEIYDLADPAAPVRLGEFPNPSSAGDVFLHDLYVAGDRAYLNFWGAGMVIVDVSNPAAPRAVGTFADYGETTSHSNWVTRVGGRSIAAHGDEQWGSHLRLVDVTEGTAGFLRETAEWKTRDEVSAHNIMAFGSRVYIAYYQDGVRVIDIADPAAPRQVAWFNTWPGYDRSYGKSFFEGAVGIDVDLARNRIYVADSNRNLMILRIDG